MTEGLEDQHLGLCESQPCRLLYPDSPARMSGSVEDYSILDLCDNILLGAFGQNGSGQ